jgi:hypothetical protein
MTDEDVKIAQRSNEKGTAAKLSNEKETGPFYLYIMGDSYAQVSEKTGWSREIIIITALHNKWHSKRLALDLADNKESVKHVLKSSMTALLAASAHAITQQSRDVLSGKTAIEDAKFIPKNMKDLEKFVQIMDKVYQLTENFEQPAIQVNIANTGTGTTNVQANEQNPRYPELPSADRMEKFKLLKAKEDTK